MFHFNYKINYYYYYYNILILIKNINLNRQKIIDILFCCCRKKNVKEENNEINLARMNDNNEVQINVNDNKNLKRNDSSNVAMINNNFFIINNNFDDKNTNKLPFNFKKYELKEINNNSNKNNYYISNNNQNEQNEILNINKFDKKESFKLFNNDKNNNNFNIITNSNKSFKNENIIDNENYNLNQINNNSKINEKIELKIIKDNFSNSKINDFYEIYCTKIYVDDKLMKNIKNNLTEYENYQRNFQTFEKYNKKNTKSSNDSNYEKKESKKSNKSNIKIKQNYSIKKEENSQEFNLIKEKNEIENDSNFEIENNSKIENKNNSIISNKSKKNSKKEKKEIKNNNSIKNSSISKKISKKNSTKEKSNNIIEKKDSKKISLIKTNEIQNTNSIKEKNSIKKNNFLEKNKNLFKNFQHIKIGLKNLGNTCYINCVLQNLINIIPLTYCFLNKYYKINKKNVKGYEGQMAEYYTDLLENLILSKKKNMRYFEPENFILTVKKCNILFNNFNVHDAMEFNIFFLDALHEDTNLYIKKVKDPNEPINPNIKAIYDKDSFNNWKKFLNYHNKSIIVDLFFGTIKYTYTCSVCSNKTCVFEIYTVLALPLSDSIKDYNKKIEGKIEIDTCFKYYFNKEKNDTNLYYCSICKKDVKRDAKISILTSAPYLIINLVRTFNRTKNFNFIDYPIYNFDVSKYVENSEGKYDLIGIVNHYGDYGALGHFTAYCKKNEKWYEFDDAGVHDIDEKNIKSNNTYILFYKRQNVMEEIDFEKLYEKYRNNNM